MSAGADPRVSRPLSQAERGRIEAMPDLAALTDRRREIYNAIDLCEDKQILLTLQEQRSQCTKIRALRQCYQREHREGFLRRKNEAIVSMQLHGVERDATTSAYQEEYVPRLKTRLPERAYLAALEANDSPLSSNPSLRIARAPQIENQESTSDSKNNATTTLGFSDSMALSRMDSSLGPRMRFRRTLDHAERTLRWSHIMPQIQNACHEISHTARREMDEEVS